MSRSGDLGPANEPRTTARLKDDIDSGRDEDKVAGFDPAAAPLGTDDEAAGDPPSEERIALAEESEYPSQTYLDAQDRSSWTVYLLIFGAVALGVVAAFALLGWGGS